MKVGSSLVTNDGLGLDRDAIAHWTEQLAALRADGVQTVLVSSGAVAEGVARLELGRRPRRIHMQQAAAAAGQMGLIQAYERGFMRHGVRAAQILLSHEDLSDRTRYLNARSALTTLLGLGAVPVVNENDTVATAELCLGDNDTLAALVANLINADLMVILTDQDGFHAADPRLQPDARVIALAAVSDGALDQAAGGSGHLGRGGMRTKLSAARLAARSGAHTVIANGRTGRILNRLARGEALGTLLRADEEPMAARKRWLAGQLTLKGALGLDPGAVGALRGGGKSLLAAGVRTVSGRFSRGDVVACRDGAGREVARGLVNYGRDEVDKLKGQGSDRFESLLGYAGDEEVIHRDNMVLAD